MQKAFYTLGCVTFLLAIFAQLAPLSDAGTITKPYNFSSGETITASKFNADFDTIYNEFNGSISTANLANDAVTTAKIADSQVTTAKIVDGTIATGDVAANAITLAKMAQLTTKTLIGNATAGTADPEVVTPATYHFGMGAHQLYLATSSVTADTLASSAVTSAKILDGTIATADVADQAVTLAKIVNASAASRFMLRGSASGAGVWQEGTADGATIEFNGTAIRVKASGITSNELGTSAVTTAKINANAVTDAKMDALSVVPVGTIVDYGGTTAPSGWLLCYGQAISRSTYSALFTAISTNYGIGDGSTTFNVPDFRGRVTVGLDTMGGVAASRVTNAGSGVDAATIGATGGDQLQQAHTHTYSPSIPTAYSSGAGAAAVSSFSGGGSPSTSSSTGGGASQNMQPCQITTKIIKTGV